MAIAEITKRAHDTGFEKGSQLGIQVCMAWLDAHGGSAFAVGIQQASVSGELESYRSLSVVDNLSEEKALPIPEISPTDIDPAPKMKMSRSEAVMSGYTGDVCGNDQCQQMTVRRNGSCTVCDTCGQTTGCS